METNITKKDIANRIAQATGINQVIAKNIIQMFLDAIIDGLAAGDRFELRDFGVFETVVRKSKKARNPRTGEEVMIPEKKVVKFKMGRLLKKKFSSPNVVTVREPGAAGPAR